jgi:hypothetical protein
MALSRSFSPAAPEMRQKNAEQIRHSFRHRETRPLRRVTDNGYHSIRRAALPANVPRCATQAATTWLSRASSVDELSFGTEQPGVRMNLLPAP